MKKIILFFVFVWIVHPVSATNTQTDWPMAGADPQRTSHNSVSVPGALNVEWYRPINPYIDNKVQAIAANGHIYLSTSKGLFAYDAGTGTQTWVFPTDLPLGNAPTYSNGILYVGGYDNRIYSINASTGVKISEYEAGAGFETNPLVLNNIVYLGNRDGNLYAFNTNNGLLSLKWKYQTGGPIRFSAAASHDGTTIYFGSDDSYAYALNTSGSLKWKSAKLPGVGFDNYWPVVWKDTYPQSSTYGREFVLFSGSKKAAWGWFHDMGFMVEYNYETLQDPTNMFAGNNGCVSSGNQTYLWIPTTVTYDCSMISNYFAANSEKSEQRHFFVLDSQNGVEITNPYAPINWAGVTRGGNKHPPVIGSDGVIYTFIGFNKGGNMTTGTYGWISGWKFGSTQTSRIYNPLSGQGDEPTAFTSGGNLIYYGEGVNADRFGTIDTLVSVNNNNFYHWDPNGQITGSQYSSLDLNGKFGGKNGAYSYFDGVSNFAPIPYNNRLYLIFGNVLVAMSAAGGGRNVGTSTSPTASPASISQNITSLQQKLESEVQKIVTAGHLRPGYMDSGILSGAMGDGYGAMVPGNYLEQYFTTPTDTIVTLSSALPYLSTTTQAQVKTYLQSEETNYPVENIIHIGWKNGAQRETYLDTTQMKNAFNAPDNGNAEVATDKRNYWRQYNELKIITPGTSSILLPEAFYGAWKYAQVFPTEAARLFNAMKSKIPKAGLNNDMTDANLLKYPYILNEYLIGYRGYVELDKLANNLSNISQSSQYAEYQRLVNLRVNNFDENVPNVPPWSTNGFDYINAMNIGRNFIYMTPELGDILRTNKLATVTQAINDYQLITPYWFVGKYDRTYGEGIFQPLYDRAALFQTKAYVLKLPFNELIKYLDVPAFEKGDLFYIQNIVAALSNGGTVPTPTSSTCRASMGDLNCDSLIDIFDYNILIGDFGKTGSPGFTAADINHDGKVDIFDYNILIGNFGK